MVRRKGQSTLEQTLLVVIIIGALLAVSFYFKRAVQSRWKGALDDLGEQYDPSTQQTTMCYYLESNTLTKMESTWQGDGYWTQRWDWSNSIEGKRGTSKVMGGL